MNMKRVLGFVAIFLGLLVPFQTAYLNVEELNNTIGLISFIACMVLLFVGYAMVDSSYPKPGAVSSEDQH